jgi:hypothetical protein
MNPQHGQDKTPGLMSTDWFWSTAYRKDHVVRRRTALMELWLSKAFCLNPKCCSHIFAAGRKVPVTKTIFCGLLLNSLFVNILQVSARYTNIIPDNEATTDQLQQSDNDQTNPVLKTTENRWRQDDKYFWEDRGSTRKKKPQKQTRQTQQMVRREKSPTFNGISQQALPKKLP